MEALFQYVPLVLVVLGMVYFAYRDYANGRKVAEVKPQEPVKIVVPHPAPAVAAVPVPAPAAAEPTSEPLPPDVEKEVSKAKVALETAGIRGKERLDTIAAVRRNEVTGDEVVEAHKK